MKKIGAVLLGLTLTLMGCSTAETTSSGLSYIEPANLSEQEMNIANLFMFNGKDYIFDLQQMKTYSLCNFKWINWKMGNG